MAFKRPESVLIVVRSAANDVLMMRRSGVDGFWQSVTGSLEDGEAPGECAVRELAEETGLVVPIRDCFVTSRFEIRSSALHRYAAGTVHNTEHLFECVLPVPVDVTLSDEHTAFTWLPADEAIERAWSSTNQDAIRQLTGMGGV